MSYISKDLEHAYNIISGLDKGNNLKIYFSTNENLTELFNNVDFRDKDVLSVLSSSDQVFSSLYLGARKVDSFDINYLTIYYHYLRKWYILYFDGLYPKDIFKSNNYIKEILSKVNCMTELEKKAYDFWDMFSLELSSRNLFNYGFDDFTIPYADNLYLFKNILKTSDVNFNHLDMFSDINLDKEYDIVIMSNLIEYAKTFEDIKMVKKNLDKLLKRKGRAIFTYIYHCPRTKIHKEQNAFFKEDYDFLMHNNDCDEEIGYSYIKK